MAHCTGLLLPLLPDGLHVREYDVLGSNKLKTLFAAGVVW
jgi:hypothetical protein